MIIITHGGNGGAGEAYDKVARLLGLQLRPSGGAAVEAFARGGDAQRFKFTMPLRMRPNCNFSYAGLKTAVRLAIEAEAPGPPTDANRQVPLLPPKITSSRDLSIRSIEFSVHA